MTIIDVIREASTEHEIYFLLTAYVEAVRYGDKFHTLPAEMRDLPLAQTANVKAQVEALKAGLGRTDILTLKARVEGLKAGLDKTDILTRPLLKEAMDIFAVALERLGSLEPGKLRRAA